MKSVRDNWEIIKAVAEGRTDKSELPLAPPKAAPKADDDFNDIPF
jgi:hypothetical protein